MKFKKVFIVLIIIVLVVGLVIFLNNRKKEKNEEFLQEIQDTFSDMIERKNYSYEVNTLDENEVNTKKIVKGNKIYIDNGNNISYYTDTETNEVYMINNNEKTYTKPDLDNKDNIILTAMQTFSNMPPIISILLTKENYFETESYNWIINNMKIENDVCNNVECYKVSYDSSKMGIDGIITTWFSKVTLLPVRYVLVDTNGVLQIDNNYNITEDISQDTQATVDNVLLDYTLIEN